MDLKLKPNVSPRKELGAQPLFNREGKVNLQCVAQMVLVVHWLERMTAHATPLFPVGKTDM